MFNDTNLIFVTLWPTVLLALSVILVALEYLVFKKKVWFTVVSSLFLIVSALLLLKQGCSLCDFLLLICATLAVRLFFEIIGGRKRDK